MVSIVLAQKPQKPHTEDMAKTIIEMKSRSVQIRQRAKDRALAHQAKIAAAPGYIALPPPVRS